MKTREFVTQLERLELPVFSIRDAARIIGKPPRYVRLFLHRAAKEEWIRRIERGRYCLLEADPLVVATNIIKPSYISFLSALEIHGSTTQIPHEVQVVSLRHRSPVEYENRRIRFVQLPRKRFFGYERQRGMTVADLEKAVIDGLYLPQYLDPSEILETLRRAEIDTKKAASYALRMDSTVCLKRLGHLLDRAGIETDLEPENTFRKKYDPLNPLLPQVGPRDSRWGLIINEVLE